MRIVLDTNVFIAAALRGGFSEDILDTLATSENFVLVTSEQILDELTQKLSSKFNWTLHDITFYLDYIRQVTEIVKVQEKVSIIKRDPDDNKVLECAIAGNANLIVSSDQDLIELKTFQEIGIIHPKTLTWTFPEYFKKVKK